MDPLLKLNNFVWGYDLSRLRAFEFDSVYKLYSKDNSSQRLLKTGYQLFVSSYFKDVYTSYNMTTDSVLVKAR